MKRIIYLDTARAFTMFLVYYGHFVEKLFREGNVIPALEHWKFVYSFHIPFFFFLSGIFWKPAPFSRQLFFQKIKTRLVPVLFFSLLLIPLWLLFEYRKFWKMLLKGEYLMGHPVFSIVLWFLVCLMMTEFLSALIVKYFKVSSTRLLVYAVLSLCFGYYILTLHGARVLTLTGINPRLWHLDAAFIALSFYLLGYLFKAILIKMNEPWGWWFSLIVAPLSFFMLWVLHRLNTEEGGVVLVMMSISVYGNIWYFFLTALMGAVFVLTFSRLFNFKFSFLSFVGQNTLIYLGLNGIGLHFLDLEIINHLPRLPTTSFEVFWFTVLYVTVVMLLFSPLVWGFRRWLPELTGYQWTPTSLLPPINEWHQRGIGNKFYLFLKTYILN